MIDALLFAVRDGIRAAEFNYGIAECEITDGGRPPPRCGNWFVSVHDGFARSIADNQLFELYGFSVTITARLGRVSIDRVGDQLIARNIVRANANREGLNAKVEQLRAFLHMNWKVVVLSGQVPNSANDNLAAWSTGTVYGFCEPMRYKSVSRPMETPPDWFGEDPGQESFGIKAELQFDNAKRFQPQFAPAGGFV